MQKLACIICIVVLFVVSGCRDEKYYNMKEQARQLKIQNVSLTRQLKGIKAQNIALSKQLDEILQEPNGILHTQLKEAKIQNTVLNEQLYNMRKVPTGYFPAVAGLCGLAVIVYLIKEKGDKV